MRGSVASYVILYDIRAFQSCIHKVNTGIDTGNVVYRKSFLIPSSARTPLEVNNFLQNKNRIMVKEFIKKFTEMEKIYDEKQNYFFSSYNKRLSSKINGWIDWSLDVDDLDRFIRAFDNPYNGAQTFIGNIKVSIKNIEKSKNEGARHPEEIGKVLRKFEEYIVVSVLNGTLYIREILKNNKNIINKIKAGDKLYTKRKFIDVKNRRVIFINKNKKIYNQKTKILK